MTPQQRLEKFVQDVNRTAFGSALISLTDVDGLEAIANTRAHLDMFLDELEMETDEIGDPVDWDFARNFNSTIGTISTASQTFPLPADIRKVIVDMNLPVTLNFAGIRIANFDVVDPDQITNQRGMTTDDRVTSIRNTLIFSRLFRPTEIGATVIAPTMSSLPRVADDSTFGVLTQVRPYQLLVLGVAKNMTLPDIIQGGLSPSFVQKYADLLDKAKAENRASSIGDTMFRENFSDVGRLN